MTPLLLVPPVLSFLLLGAHFYRSSTDGLVAICVVLAVVACVPRRWATLVARGALAFGAFEWARTATGIATERIAQGQPWLRMAIILGAVALFTLASTLVFWSRRLQARVQGGSGA